MAIKNESTRNTFNDPNIPLGIGLNTNTYTELLSANKDRSFYRISNPDSHDILVKEKATATPDSLDRGFIVFKRSLYETDGNVIATGIISAKSLTGNPTVLPMENG